jgi:hypothetical protein
MHYARKYRSRIGKELIIPISIIIGGTGILMIYEKVWIGLIVILLSVAFIVYMFLSTAYEVEQNILKIRSGFFFHRTIPIDSIKEIRATRNPISSPAASLDRLLIISNMSDSIMVSPKDKEAFVDHLTAINPNIQTFIKSHAERKERG